jgi:hypothetical protein
MIARNTVFQAELIEQTVLPPYLHTIMTPTPCDKHQVRESRQESACNRSSSTASAITGHSTVRPLLATRVAGCGSTVPHPQPQFRKLRRRCGSRSPHQKRTREDGCNCTAKRTISILRELRNGATATRDRGVRAAPRRRN